ncbi:MAG: hypothetical protein RL701_2472 [Pseudomonadota bacterium]|jgi:diadenosine tetraphosphatase ApaH/serine/threonine PP2A family protein phosphatase
MSHQPQDERRSAYERLVPLTKLIWFRLGCGWTWTRLVLTEVVRGTGFLPRATQRARRQLPQPQTPRTYNTKHTLH